MAAYPTSREGFHYKDDTVHEGLYSEAAVKGTKSIRQFYDIIVVGGGFTGLSAARGLLLLGNLFLSLKQETELVVVLGPRNLVVTIWRVSIRPYIIQGTKLS